MSFKVILMRSALKQREEHEAIIKQVKVLQDNLSPNEINVLGDALNEMKVKAGDVI